MTQTARTYSPSRWFAWPVLIPVLLGILFALGVQATDGKGTIDLTAFTFWQYLVASELIFVGGFSLAYHLLVTVPAKKAAAARLASAKEGSLGATAFASTAPSKVADPTGASAAEAHGLRRFLSFGWSPAPVILGALVILACWMVYIVLLFPGTMWYDTSWQVYEYYAQSYSDHHPFLLVFLFGWFIDLGRFLFNDGAAGLFILIAIQIAATVTAFSLICSYLRRVGVRWGVCLGFLLFFALFPFFPMTFVSIVKDTLQATLFMYFALLFAEVVRTRGDVLRHWWVPVAFILLGLGICVSKKTGIYMVAIPLIACAFMHLRNGGRALLPLIGALLAVFMFIFLPRVVMPAMGVEPGGKQEMLAVPIQQVAHEYVLYSKGVEGYEDAFSAEDIKLLDDFLIINHADIPSEFDYTIVDPIKDGALADETLIPEFLQLWARLGLEHPMGHLEAWIGMEAGWVSYEPAITVKVASGTIANNDLVSQYVTWPDSSWKNDFVTRLYNFVGSIPLLNVSYSSALWASVLPAFGLYLLSRAKSAPGRRGRMLLAVSPWLMAAVTLFVCPVSTGVEVARYILPLTCLAFLCLGMEVVWMRQGVVDGLAPLPGNEDAEVAVETTTEAAVEAAGGGQHNTPPSPVTLG